MIANIAQWLRGRYYCYQLWQIEHLLLRIATVFVSGIDLKQPLKK